MAVDGENYLRSGLEARLRGRGDFNRLIACDVAGFGGDELTV